MAFQQPTRQAVARPIRDDHDEHDSQTPTAFAGPQPTTEESQTWVLFSPNTDTETTTGASSILSSLPDSQPTPGRSRLSDLGSLSRSNYASNYASSYAQSSVAFRPAPPLHLSLQTSSTSNTDGDEIVRASGRDNEAEDDAELDSLDSHLADFRGAPGNNAQAHATTVQPQSQAPTPQHMTTAATTVNLPTHDGLGSFRLGNTVGMDASAVQEHLYAFEQFNPNRVAKRRRESLGLGAQIELDNDLVEELERTRRIEEWRWEHSRVLLEEIQKQTRRRRGSELSISRRSRTGSSPAVATGDAISENATATDVLSGEANGDWHDQEEDERLIGQQTNTEAGENEGVWSRITRKFMLEVMGIDDRILSLIFGESIAQTDEEAAEKSDEVDLSSTPKASDAARAAAAAVASDVDNDTDSLGQAAQQDETPSWQLRMIERIAKELGVFVHQHVSAHPGAFSTFVRVQQMPLPYAGLPVIPEALTPPDREMAAPVNAETAETRGGRKWSAAGEDLAATATAMGSSGPHFKPTIYQAKPMDIPDKADGKTASAASAASAAASTTASSAATFTQEEWEQDLDIKLVFRYLRSRFMSDKTPTPSHHHVSHHRRGSSSSSINMQDAAAKAARVRQHHPLVGRNAARQAGDRRSGPVSAYRNLGVATATPSSPILNISMRHPHGTATSCASQSTRRSARRSSVSSRHSSRHYWDIGGSIGTGSVIASAGPMGSWGEA